jgi:RNA polymerase sigma factor (sigma-70 family)
MAKEQLDRVVRHIRNLVRDPATSGLTDGQLLERFAAHQDQAAFETLVTRHAPLVLGVCRRTLHDHHDTEDAFQAVFLVLARKAGRLDRRAPLSNWLFTVARLVALKMRAKNANRRAQEAKRQPPGPSDPLAEITARELYAALDEELAQLAEKYRAPLVLCHLAGRTQDEAARQLGLSLATLKRRLEQGRACLRRRLTGRGLSLPAALLAALVSQPNRSAAGLEPLVYATAQAGLLFNASRTAGPISTRAGALARELLQTMLVSRLKTIGVALVGLILATSAVGFLSHAPVAADSRTSDPVRTPTQESGPAPVRPARLERTDRAGDPLPAGALVRLGTVRFRHGFRVDRLTFSPSGKLVASWDCFRGVVLWDAASGRPIRELPVGIDARSVAFAPDGNTLAIPHNCARDFVIGLFDVATGREVRQLKGLRTNFPAVAFSHNGKLLAAAGYDRSLRLWEVATGRELRRLRKGAEGGVTEFFQGIAFSPDDEILASTLGKEPIVLWKVASGEVLRRLPGQRWPVDFVSFSRDGQTLISAGKDAFRLWEVATGKELRVFGKVPENVCCSRDGKMLASSHGSWIRVWDVATGKPVRQWRATSEDIRSLAFAPDGKRLAWGGVWNSAIHLWELATGKEVALGGTHQGTISGLAFDEGGKALLAASSDRVVCQWDLTTQSPRRLCRVDGRKTVFTAAFSPDRKTFATLGPERALRVHDLATGKVVQSLAMPAPSGPGRLAYTPDGKTLAAAGDDLTVRLWDLGTGKEVRRFQGPRAWIACLAISPDGRILAAADSCETHSVHKVYLWDLVTGKEMAQLESKSVIQSIAFSTDARLLAVAGQGPWLELWEVQSGKKTRQMQWTEPRREWYTTQGHTNRLAFSNDTRLLAAGGSGKRPEDHAIRVWDVVTGQEVCRFAGHPSAVTQLAFSPDDRALASGGTDSTIVLWDVAVRRKGGPDGPRLSLQELSTRWNDLAGPDAARAYQAVWRLAASPEQSVPFLRGQLRPVAPVDRNKIDRLVADLDNNRFAVRARATSALEQLGPAAEAAIREYLAGKVPSVESRRRLELILARLDPARSSPMLRALRAVAALEYSRSAQARSLLQKVAEGSPHARLTREAKAALERLARQTAGRR